MFKTLASFIVVAALVCSLCGPLSLAQSSVLSETGTIGSPSSGTRITNEAQPNEKLKTDVATLLRDAEAGKLVPVPKSQIQPAKGNSLSKTTKIAIVLGMVLVVTAIIIYKNFEYDCKSRCVL